MSAMRSARGITVNVTGTGLEKIYSAKGTDIYRLAG